MRQTITNAGLWAGILACLVFIPLSVGCGGDPNMGDVKGVVTLDGKPLPDAFIQFAPQSETFGAPSFGKTDANGNYHMQFSDTKDGVFIGANNVEIRTGDVKADNSGSTPEVVPNVYNTKTTLVAEVKTGANVFDWELKSDASEISRVETD